MRVQRVSGKLSSWPLEQNPRIRVLYPFELANEHPIGGVIPPTRWTLTSPLLLWKNPCWRQFFSPTLCVRTYVWTHTFMLLIEQKVYCNYIDDSATIPCLCFRPHEPIVHGDWVHRPQTLTSGWRLVMVMLEDQVWSCCLWLGLHFNLGCLAIHCSKGGMLTQISCCYAQQS